MNLFFNISHPAHVHFFKHAIKQLIDRGHKIIVGARKKEFTIDLLNAYKIEHVLLTNKGEGFWGLIKELTEQQIKLYPLIKKHRIDLMLQIGGIFNAPIGKLLGIPTLAFSDTENDIITNKIAFKLSSHVLLPSCFNRQIGGTWKKQVHYPGYHELAYLSPKKVKSDIKAGTNILIRFVGWGAGHDIGEVGLSNKQKIELINILKQTTDKIHISSEGPLPNEIRHFTSSIHPAEIHDFLKTCKLVIGESATMTSEAACLGIPAIFISNTGRGYTTEQDEKYDLIRHYKLNQWDKIIDTIKEWSKKDLYEEWQKKRSHMLRDKIEVTDWMIDLIENYPESIETAKTQNYLKAGLMCVE